MSVRCFDIQVNGFFGIDFSDAGLTRGGVNRVAEGLAAQGTEKFLPTVITSPVTTYEHVLPVLGAAAREDARIGGIHIEGPFISPLDGAVGAHPKSCVQEPSIDAFRRLQELAGGKIRLVTLAPELPGSIRLIEYLVENNVVVSVGHTLADAGHIADACRAGASLATHVGNGIPNQLNRTDNTIWSIIASSLTLMLITDGFHLPADFVRVAYAAKGAGQLIITSDSAPVAGLEAGEYEIFGTRVRLTEDGCVRNLKAPTLAGSGATLNQCVEKCREILEVSNETLQQMSFENAQILFGAQG